VVLANEAICQLLDIEAGSMFLEGSSTVDILHGKSMAAAAVEILQNDFPILILLENFLGSILADSIDSKSCADDDKVPSDGAIYTPTNSTTQPSSSGHNNLVKTAVHDVSVKL
jgi:hypothetical protein